ncbi:Hypothetical predicted protein [Cloeon dipterum]|uniref:TNFR-Cys domain-containing protein n=1 Tax=Cloeon dipterum TaxID=197152 RepID=A0A8S1C140_9INSE|nr:Hypothetical predicted protein [Cloeon dipterum]
MMDLRVARRWQVVLVLVVIQFLCPSETARVNMLASNTKCSKCPPGFGMVQLCSPLNDTVCVDCPPGFYSSHNSAFERCYPCSKCGPGLYEAQSCTTRTDTVCDRCATVMGPHNRDFFSKHCNDTIFVMEQPKPSSAWRNELFVQYQHLPVADHQKLTAPAAERALWPTLAAAIAVIFGVAALLVTIVQGARSHFTRNIQVRMLFKSRLKSRTPFFNDFMESILPTMRCEKSTQSYQQSDKFSLALFDQKFFNPSFFLIFLFYLKIS